MVRPYSFGFLMVANTYNILGFGSRYLPKPTGKPFSMYQNLIALRSGAWSRFLSGLEDEKPALAKNQNTAHTTLGQLWEAAYLQTQNAEIAVFQPSLLGLNDPFPAAFRRFVQVGNSDAEILQNLFELGFEKGFGQVSFVEEYAYKGLTDFLSEIPGDKQPDMVFGPNEDGSLYGWTMKKRHFRNWAGFEYTTPESIVELLSLCHESGISYRVASPIDRKEAEQDFIDALQLPR